MNAYIITTGLGPVNDFDQLTLGIDYAPQQVRRHGLREAHIYPFVSHGQRPGHMDQRIVYSSQQQPGSTKKSNSEHPHRRPVLVLDCDAGQQVTQIAAGYAGVLPFPSPGLHGVLARSHVTRRIA